MTGFTIIAFLAIPFGMALFAAFALVNSGSADAPAEALPPPSYLEKSAMDWMAASPWPGLAQANGWQCVDDRPIYASAAYRINGEIDGHSFEAISSLHPNLEFGLRERLLVRSRSRKPPQGMPFRGSHVSWEFQIALLKPDQCWLSNQGDTQALQWKDPHLELTLAAPGTPKATLLQTMALFTALRHAEFPSWYNAGPDWILRMDSTGEWPRLSRLVDGVQVSANLEWAQGTLRTRIMAPLPPQDTRFSLVHPDFQDAPRVRTRHPIADSLLHAAGDGEALHRLLQSPEAFSAIMAIVHGHPGSRLTQDRIELIAAGDMGEGLLAAMEKVVQAARAISAREE